MFAYSLDGTNYTDMLAVTRTSDDDAYQSYVFPGSLAGTVFVRVRDSDRSRGNLALDTVTIDHMFIRSE